MKEKINEYEQNEKENKRPPLDKQLILKKMQNFLKTVETEENEKREAELTTPYHSKRYDQTKRNNSRSISLEKNSYRTHSRSSSLKRGYSRSRIRRLQTDCVDRKSRLSSGKYEKDKRKTRISPKGEINRNRDRSDDFHAQHKTKVHHDTYEIKRKLGEVEYKNEMGNTYSRRDSYSSNEKYGKKCRFEHREWDARYEPVHKERRIEKRRTDNRYKQRDKEKICFTPSSSSSSSSCDVEKSEYRYKRKEGDHLSSSINRRKKWKNEEDCYDYGDRKHSKFVPSKSTSETVKMKFSPIPLGFHTTKENWESYTNWLKKKNQYRFDLPFDEHRIYRRSASLSPSTWERFVKDSDEDEAKTKASDRSKSYTKRTHKEKSKKRTTSNSSRGESNITSSKKSDSSDSKNKREEKNRGYEMKRTHRKNSHRKKTTRKEEKRREKRKRKNKKEEKKRKHKGNHKRKKRKKKSSYESYSESIPSSMTSVSFLNYEWDLEDKAFGTQGVLNENKKKEEGRENTVTDEVKENIDALFKVSERNTKNRIDEKGEEEHLKVNQTSTAKKENVTNQVNEKEENEARKNFVEESDDGSDIGPKPLDITMKLANKQISYGAAMMPGEGEAIAQFVQKGKRIPRRGEVGLSAEDIENYEKLGYVMSGSRHKRMNAIRMRKENQVYSAEEQRALAMYNYEERAIRENALINDLKEILRKQNEAIMNETQEGME